MSSRCDVTAEWLEPDGLGGFASGTVGGERTRRYHALLLAATAPPGGRVVLVNGFDAWIETVTGRYPLSTQRYHPDVLYPDAVGSLSAFTDDPWPTWTFTLPDGTRLRHECRVRHGSGVVVLSWALEAGGPARLEVRPFLSGRDFHGLHHENGGFAFQPATVDGRLVWHPYPGLPGIAAVSNGVYEHAADWNRQFLYRSELARGLDHVEDLAAPGWFRWGLEQGEAWLGFAIDEAVPRPVAAQAWLAELSAAERARRAAFHSRLARSADAYVTQRGAGDERTIVAGYPWFTDWGRDTFIALRGLCLATGRLEDARRILLAWAPLVSEGMLPNRFTDDGSAPEYNSVDAALWYVVAVHDFLAAAPQTSASDAARLHVAVDAIVAGYAKGTRYGIRLTDGGLLAAGSPGVQLTWMDAKVGDWVVTPRIGKPIEIQALWLNALRIAGARSLRWREVATQGLAAFRRRFLRPDGHGAFDVVDVDHQPGAVDASVRPNQIFAVGGLPFPVLDGADARAVVDTVEQRLWTPLGLRTLAADDPRYVPRYEGGVRERDGAYHQGTVWPWLLGPFVEAWVRVRGETPAAKAAARAAFVAPRLADLNRAGLGHIAEIADAEAPHAPRGCPFQAWSVGELLRLDRVVLQP